MTDLFSHTPTAKPKPKVGQGNGAFLADLAMGVPDQTMRERFKAGEYPDLHPKFARAWRRLFGRTS